MSDSTPHWLDYVKSEPLTRDELSTFYQISTKHVGAYVDSLTGTKRCHDATRCLGCGNRSRYDEAEPTPCPSATHSVW